MQTTWEQALWINHNPIQRQFTAFVISAVIVILILLIPISLNYDFSQKDNAIEVILSKDSSPFDSDSSVVQQPKTKPEIIEKPIVEPIVQKTLEPIKPVEKIVENKPIAVTPKIIEQPTQAPKDEQMAKLPSSAVIFNSAYGKVHLYELDDDFKARTGDEGEFKFKEVEQHRIYKVTKLIDEEKDKPRVEMEFYSDGFVGSIERFIDKISYGKEFTNRYGTKIKCGGVGPLAMCSWK